MPLEYIDVAEQHRSYAPDDPMTQHDLTTAASESALAYQMLKCLNCSLEFGEPMRAPSAAWYQLAYRAQKLYPEVRWEFGEVLRRIRKGDRVFEFGCGSGSFLLCCQQHGLSASGMDFSNDAVQECVARGLAVRRLDLDEISGATGGDRFNHMTAFHFLEHLDRPATLFEQATARALPSSHLWVSVPGDRRPSRFFGERDFLDQPPHHMTRWTFDSFRKIGDCHGWRLSETLYEPIPLRAALWSISVSSTMYRKLNNAGKFQNPAVERIFRVFVMPAAMLRRLTIDRHLTGFSMLAHFVFDINDRRAAPEAI
jgi:SAM-dependent methyltransferase